MTPDQWWRKVGYGVMAAGAVWFGSELIESLTAEDQRRPSRALRERVLERDGRACRYCGVLTTVRTRHFDHRIPVARGGRTSFRNLCVACRACNLAKGTMTAREFESLFQ